MPRQPIRRFPSGTGGCQVPNPAPGRTTRPEADEIEAENGAESRRPFVLEGAFFMKRDIRERLKAEVLLTDGAMGTLLVSRGAPAEGPRSPNSVAAPELVREIHDDYVAAGAQRSEEHTSELQSLRH